MGVFVKWNFASPNSTLCSRPWTNEYLVNIPYKYTETLRNGCLYSLEQIRYFCHPFIVNIYKIIISNRFVQRLVLYFSQRNRATNKKLRKKMEDKHILLDNIDKIHTTEMGSNRIKRNLKIDTADVVEYCVNKVLAPNCNIYKQGKNWYCEVENIRITINSYSYTIITAHIVK